MAGTLVVDTLNKSSGVLATQNGMTGIAKAWVQFNGVSVAISGSFNIASVTKITTGQYTINFTNTMPSTDYAVQCTYTFNGGTPYAPGYYTTTKTTGSVGVFAPSGEPTLYSVTIFSA